MDRVCPLLALAGDRRTAVDGADAAHRCYAEDPPQPIDRPVQVGLCLTVDHPRCERYVAFVRRGDGVTPGRVALGDGFVSTRMVVTPQPGWRGIAGRGPRARRWPFALAAVALLVIGAAGAAAMALGQQPADGAAANPSPSTSPSTAPSPAKTAQLATPRPTHSPTPAATPTSTPTSAPTPTPPPALPTAAPATPATARTYVVAAGDTLAAIAQRFATTVAALQALNGIDDPDEIVIGQVLVLP